MENSLYFCSFCGNLCDKQELIVKKDNVLYYANKIECHNCKYAVYNLEDKICGTESPDRYSFFLQKAIDISK